MQANNAIIIIDLKYTDINLKVLRRNCSWHRKILDRKSVFIFTCVYVWQKLLLQPWPVYWCCRKLVRDGAQCHVSTCCSWLPAEITSPSIHPQVVREKHGSCWWPPPHPAPGASPRKLSWPGPPPRSARPPGEAGLALEDKSMSSPRSRHCHRQPRQRASQWKPKNGNFSSAAAKIKV